MGAGRYIGYDPGGDGKHGVAILEMAGGKPVSLRTALLKTTEEVIGWIRGNGEQIHGLGIDTLTCWSSGPSGWRPADRWLRKRYPEVRGSIASSNSLYGAMAVNGMSALVALRAMLPDLLITETHPKVLHWHLRRAKYDFAASRAEMEQYLADELGCSIVTASDHEWDAGISAVAAFRGAAGQWTLDLHALTPSPGERILQPCGPTKYFWPA